MKVQPRGRISCWRGQWVLVGGVPGGLRTTGPTDEALVEGGALGSRGSCSMKFAEMGPMGERLEWRAVRTWASALMRTKWRHLPADLELFSQDWMSREADCRWPWLL